MADNVVLNAGVGGSTARTKDRTGIETQIVGLDLNPSGAEVLSFGSATFGLAVEVKRARVAGTATLSNATASTSNATVLASNANRVGVVFINDDPASPVYLKYGATASTTSYTRRLQPLEQWEPLVDYTGQVDGIWTGSPTGALRVTELTT